MLINALINAYETPVVFFHEILASDMTSVTDLHNMRRWFKFRTSNFAAV